MHKPAIILSLFFGFLFIGSMTAAQTDFTPIAGWDQQLFPSFVIGTATLKTDGATAPDSQLGDSNGLLGISIQAPRDDAKVEVTIDGAPFIHASQFSGTMSKQGTTYSVLPKIKYDFEALSKCSQATPASVTFRVQIDGGDVLEKTVTMTVRPISDCPIKIQVGDEIIDRSFAFATYVNEQHPFTDKLLREALDIGIVGQFVGYQAKSDEAVLKQVYAIWDLLVSRDVRYSSITKTATDSNHILSQNVRLLEDTINNQQANCVDGSVLLVSLLRKIDIESFLILVPGHCYVGFYVDEDQKRILAIETTLMGSEVDEPEQIADVLQAAVGDELRGEYSWPSFVQALEVGTANWLESKEKFSNPGELDYRVIDIASARKMGVLPIPFRGSEAFLQFDHSVDSSESDSDSEFVSESESVSEEDEEPAEEYESEEEDDDEYSDEESE